MGRGQGDLEAACKEAGQWGPEREAGLTGQKPPSK